MFACNTTFIKAHSGRTSYYNHSFDRCVREVYCAECMKFIGKQVMYEDQDEYNFENDNIKNYIYCPYCAHKFNKERIYHA